MRSKGSDGFTPLGPAYLPAESIDPAALQLTTWVNGERVQDAKLGEELIFGFGDIIADLSRLMTLEPGDVVLTGTPAGSTVVQPGDVVEVEVTAGDVTTGRLRTPIEADPEPLAPWGAMPGATAQDVRDAYGHDITTEAGGAVAAASDDPLADRFGADVAAGLRTVSTATLTSQLTKRGLAGCILDELHPTRPDGRVVGFARTLRFLPLREDVFARRAGGFNAQKQAVEAIGPGDVLVISARGERNAGTIGDILARRAELRGAAGIVTDGAIRDAPVIAALGLPVFSASRHPAPLGRHHVPWEVDVAIDCAGALVEPGDVIVGDGDGVVVLPPDHVAAVVTAAIVAGARGALHPRAGRAGRVGRRPVPDERQLARPLRGEPGRRRQRTIRHEGTRVKFRSDPSSVHGSIAPVVTPFTAAGDLDEDSLRSLVRWQLASGSHGVSIGGSTGEPSSQSVAERIRAMAVVAEETAGTACRSFPAPARQSWTRPSR